MVDKVFGIGRLVKSLSEPSNMKCFGLAMVQNL